MILRGDTDDRLFHNVAVSLIQPEEGPLRGTAAIDRSARIGTAFSQVRERRIRQGRTTFCWRCNTDTSQRGGNGHYSRQHKRQMPEGSSTEWGKVYAVLTDSKNMQAGILKKSKVLSLRCKKVCHKSK